MRKAILVICLAVLGLAVLDRVAVAPPPAREVARDVPFVCPLFADAGSAEIVAWTDGDGPLRGERVLVRWDVRQAWLKVGRWQPLPRDAVGGFLLHVSDLAQAWRDTREQDRSFWSDVEVMASWTCDGAPASKDAAAPRVRYAAFSDRGARALNIIRAFRERWRGETPVYIAVRSLPGRDLVPEQAASPVGGQ